MPTLIGYQTPWGIKFLNVLTTGSDYWQAWWGDNNYIFGDAGNDTMIGNVGNDTLAGGADKDTIYGGGGNDDLFGDSGDDFLAGGLGIDQLYGGTGKDKLFSNHSTEDVSFTIQTVADALFDTGGFLNGGAGDDTLYVDVFLNGALGLDGGDDTDLIDFSNQHNIWANGTPSNLALNRLDLELGSGETTFGGQLTVVRVENVTGSEYRDQFLGTDVRNILKGLSGDDVLEGRGGGDTLDGGAGHDAAQYTSASTGVEVDLARSSQNATTIRAGVALSNGDAAGDFLISIEELRGSGFDDILRGRSGGGLPSNEDFFGDSGNDIIEGRFGADAIDGGVGFDFASYEGSAGAVAVALARPGLASNAQFNDAAGDTLVRIEGLIGSFFNDTLIGNDDVNELRGDHGDDTLSGLGGADTILGGAGLDSITGGGGRDTMYGMGGADTFKFFSVLDSNGTFQQRDLIQDFTRDSLERTSTGFVSVPGDTIDLSAIDANQLAGGNQEFRFIAGDSFSGAAQVRVVAATDTAGRVYDLVQAEVNGDGVADFQLSVYTSTINNVLLTASDFVL